MKKALLLLVCLLIGIPVFAEIVIDGSNYAQYAYRAAEDSLHNYFYDELTFRLRYGDVTVGQIFTARMPEYKGFADDNIDELNSSDITFDWDERWLSYDTQDLTLLAGTMDGTIGRGIVFRSFRDRDLDIDTRMDGAKLRWSRNAGTFNAFYGARPIEFNDGETRNETASGIDYETHLPMGFRIGGSAVLLETLDLNDDTYTYGKALIGGGRGGFSSGWLDLYGEYASLNFTKPGEEERDGHAVYADATMYYGKFTLMGAYKDYDQFHQRTDPINPLNDLPTVNHCGEPLSDSGLMAGQDEVGAMGELTWRPDYSSEYIVNYAEGWSHDGEDYTQANLYLKAKRDIGDVTLTAEYEHVETRNEPYEVWELRRTPELTADFMWMDMPVTLMAQWEHYEKTIASDKEYHYEPLLQMDLGWNEVSISVACEQSYTTSEDLFEGTPWLNAEIALPLTDNTDLRLFGGRQKGGKVCRNGICRQQSEFEGIKAELTTTF